MKIIDLLSEDLVNPEWKEKNYNGVLKARSDLRNNHEKIIGSGNNSAAKDDPSDPHMVKKHNIRTYTSPSEETDGTNDGFNKFIEYLIVNNRMDNIHFPKVYDISTIKDKRGQRIHTYKIEKLIDSKEVSPEEVEAFIERDLGPEFKTYGKGTIAVIESACDYIGDCIIDPSWNKDRLALMSESMREAIKTLSHISLVIRQRPDLHSGNIMWRRTPHGLIFVFNDPFY